MSHGRENIQADRVRNWPLQTHTRLGWPLRGAAVCELLQIPKNRNAMMKAASERTRSVEPDHAHRSAFDERYRKWRELYASLHSWTI